MSSLAEAVQRQASPIERKPRGLGLFTTELTNREIEVLRLISEGLCDKDIAVRLGISLETAKSHGKHLRTKTGMENRTALTLYAIRKGLVTP